MQLNNGQPLGSGKTKVLARVVDSRGVTIRYRHPNGRVTNVATPRLPQGPVGNTHRGPAVQSTPAGVPVRVPALPLPRSVAASLSAVTNAPPAGATPSLRPVAPPFAMPSRTLPYPDQGSSAPSASQTSNFGASSNPATPSLGAKPSQSSMSNSLGRFLYGQQRSWLEEEQRTTITTLQPIFLYHDDLIKLLQLRPQEKVMVVEVEWLRFTPTYLRGSKAAIGFKITKDQFADAQQAGLAGRYMVELLHEDGFNLPGSVNAYYAAGRCGKYYQPDDKLVCEVIPKHLNIEFETITDRKGAQRFLPHLLCTSKELAARLR